MADKITSLPDDAAWTNRGDDGAPPDDTTSNPPPQPPRPLPLAHLPRRAAPPGPVRAAPVTARRRAELPARATMPRPSGFIWPPPRWAAADEEQGLDAEDGSFGRQSLGDEAPSRLLLQVFEPEDASPATSSSTPRSASLDVRTLGLCAGPLLDMTAAGLSLATARLADHPVAARITGVASGVFWLGGAVFQELGNSPRRRVLSAANLFGGVAGLLGGTAAALTGDRQTGAGAGSATAWVLNGGIYLVRALGDRRPPVSTRLLQATAGAANVAAAGLAAAATSAGANGGSVDEVSDLGTISSILWGGGAVALAGAALLAWRADRARGGSF